jgi:prophage regulatory protein
MTSQTKPERLLRLQGVMERTGCKRAKLYQLVARGAFPKPVKIDSCAHWPESQVDAWVASRIAAAEAAA